MTERAVGALLLGSLLTSLAFAQGCGEDLFVGSVCSTLDCPEARPPIDPSDCRAEFVVQSADVAPDQILEQCQLFTLGELPAVGPQGQAYLTFAQITTMPVSQDVDVQLVPKLEEFPDGPVDCRELATRALPWIPVMAAVSSGGYSDFSAAPLVTAPHHRLRIFRRFNNEGGDRSALGRCT